MIASGTLAAVKISIGLMAHSTAAVSDGFESASDVFASGIVLFGLLLAAKPADEEHPYGHGRVEMLAGLAVGLMLAATGTAICVRAVDHIQHPETPALFAIWPLLGSVVVKAGLSSLKFHFGRKINSEALIADAWNDTVDILSGLTAFAAVMLAVWKPVQFASADGWGAFAVGAIVMFLGGRVVYDTTNLLMDVMPDKARLDEIREVVLSVPGALAVEKCYARKTGLRYHVDLHLEVEPAMTVQRSHLLAHAVRDRVLAKLSWVADVLVHVEPHMAATIESGPEWRIGKSQ